MTLRQEIVGRGLPRDWLIANFVTDTTGRVQIDGSSRKLSNEVDKQALLAYRDLAQLVLTSANTARAEGYHRLRHKPLAIASRTADFSGIPALSGDGLLFLIVPRSFRKQATQNYRAPNTIVISLRKYSPRKIRRALKIRGFRRIVLEAGVAFTAWFAAGRAISELALSIVGLKGDFAPSAAAAFLKKLDTADFDLLRINQVEDTALTTWAVSARNH